MPRIRVGAAAAAILSVSIVGAAAQTAPVGQPLPILQIAQPHGKSEWRRHDSGRRAIRRASADRVLIRRRLADKERARRRLADRRAAEHRAESREKEFAHKDVAGRRLAGHTLADNDRRAAEAPSAAASTMTWPASAGTVPGAFPAMAPPAAAAISTAPVIDSAPDGILHGQHAVQAVPAGAIESAAAAATPPAAASAQPPATSATQKPPIAVAAANSEPQTPVVHALVVTKSADPMGSTTWIAHVLAALGGAIAAGVVAWFLIGPSTRQNYG